MGLNNSQYDNLYRVYEERQLATRLMTAERYKRLCDRIPGFRELSEQAASISLEQGRKLIAGDENAVSEQRKLLAANREKKLALLKNAGYPDNYLEPVYVCQECKDTGYIGSVKCRCFQQSILSLLYKQSHIEDLLKTENFSTLSYKYYQGDDLRRFEDAVSISKKFIENFDSDYQNMFFYGTVGTGKSFLSGCVAKELLDSGHSVIYFSSAMLFDSLSSLNSGYSFREELKSLQEDLFHCDLLVIDDLGTELYNTFVSSQLFTCINERHLRRKSTIISTNLTLEGLRDRYSDRIFSRITMQYELLKLSGLDIRTYTKRIRNRK